MFVFRDLTKLPTYSAGSTHRGELMVKTDYRTAADMLAAHPGLLADAALYRVVRLLKGQAVAQAEAGPALVPLIDQWHRLQATESKMGRKLVAQEDRAARAHRRELRAAQRREAATCPAPLYSAG
jgi:hypothetical protein